MSETTVHKYSGWPGKAVCGVKGEITSIKSEDVTCANCDSKPAPRAESTEPAIAGYWCGICKATSEPCEHMKPIILASGTEGSAEQAAACLDCGLPYEKFPLDVILPRSQWMEIHPADGGLLCASCIVKRAAKVPGIICVHAILEIASVPRQRLQEIEGKGWSDVERELSDAHTALTAAQAEIQRMRNEIQKAIDMIPGSMGGHVTLGLNILQAALRTQGGESKP